MKRLLLAIVSVGLTVSAVRAATAVSGPEIDPEAIINDSYQFLRNREPVMTGAEYSLYETIIPMVFEQPDYAIRLLETMISDDEPESPAFEFVLANMYFMQGRLESAESRYRSAISQYPEFLRAWFNLGVMRFTMERYAEAIPCFTRVLALGNRDARTLALLGYCLQRTGNGLVAEMAYMQALVTEPDNPDLIEGLLKLYLENGDRDRAESLLRRLVQINPADGEKQVLFAKTLHDSGKTLESVVVLEVTRSLGVLDEDGLLFLGNLYADQGMFTEAVDAFQQVVEVNPELGVDRLITFAWVLTEDTQLDRASQVLAGIAADVTPEMKVRFLRVRAELAHALLDWDEARIHLEALLALRPMDGDGLVRLGQVHLMAGDLARAELVFERAFQVDDSRYRASLELANLAVRNRGYDQSVAYLEQAISLQPSPQLKEHLERLKALVSFSGMHEPQGSVHLK